MKKTIFLLIFTLLLAGSGVAQSLAPIETGAEVQNLGLTGVESEAGEMDVLNNVFRGNSFALISDDRSNPTSLTVSLDYTPVDGEPGVYTVVGGSWTLMVYEKGIFVGTLFGDVTDGAVRDTVDEGSGDTGQRQVKTSFHITGGTERYENIETEGMPNGTYSAFTDYTDNDRTTAVLFDVL